MRYDYGLWWLVAIHIAGLLFLVILGALVQWPTVPTLLMAPVLVVAYVRLVSALLVAAGLAGLWLIRQPTQRSDESVSA